MSEPVVDHGRVEVERRRRAGRMASGGAIRDAATALFLEKGYTLTSMDDIAEAAQVSKQTIYTHFANKEELFAELVLSNAETAERFVVMIGPTLENAANDLESALRQLAREYLRLVMQPQVLRMRRLVLGEVRRFPKLARTYYERVPGRVYEALSAVFKRLADEGRLQIDDPMLAAHHFAWLTLGIPLDRGMFYPIQDVVPDEEIERVAHSAVRVFLAAYGALRI